jgi:hypothetical protein
MGEIGLGSGGEEGDDAASACGIGQQKRKVARNSPD